MEQDTNSSIPARKKSSKLYILAIFFILCAIGVAIVAKKYEAAVGICGAKMVSAESEDQKTALKTEQDHLLQQIFRWQLAASLLMLITFLFWTIALFYHGKKYRYVTILMALLVLFLVLEFTIV